VQGADRGTKALPEPPLLVITEKSLTPDGLEAQIAGALAGGCRWVLLRDKDLDHEIRRDLLMRLLPLVREAGAMLCVSDDMELARLADGCHVNSKGDPSQARAVLGPEALIGFSAHNLEEALYAQRARADYVTLSPIFPPISKPGYGPVLGPEGLAAIAGALSIPVIALGGITAERVIPCRDAGAKGVAVLGSVMASDQPKEIVINIIQHIKAKSKSTI
jgi:thiamine-phosphate pyrophosphorylase